MHLFKNKKIVISGGPGSGKTTLINLLRVKGYECMDEFSRTIIKRAQNQGENSFFKSQPLEFSKEVWNGRKEQYQNSKPSSSKTQKSYVFFDRGLHDVLAYMDCLGVTYDNCKFDLSGFPYDLAVLLPPRKSIYIKDNERKEGFQEAQKIYFYIKKTYQKYNIPIVEVPFQSPEVRISTLLEYLDHAEKA